MCRAMNQLTIEPVLCPCRHLVVIIDSALALLEARLVYLALGGQYHHCCTGTTRLEPSGPFTNCFGVMNAATA